jgi:flagellar hook-associated protein 3 FlgL
MRISTGYEFELYRRDIEGAQARLTAAQRRVATGKRFERGAEDPAAAQTVVRGRALQAWVARTDANLRTATDYLGTAETALTETVASLRQAYAIAVRGADATASQDERNAMAKEVETIQRRLLDLANSRANGGQYIFAGHTSLTKPFRTLDGLIYEGDGQPVRVETDPGKLQRVDVPGAPQFFVKAYERLSRLRDHLLSNDPGSIGNEDLGMVDASIKDALGLLGETGYGLQEVASLRERHVRRTDELAQWISDAEDVDLTEAVTQLQFAETAYQAALRSASLASRLRLMDYLR